MSVIVRPELNPGTKPVFGSGYRLNPDHPLNNGLVTWCLFNEVAGVPRDLVTGKFATVTGSPIYSTAYGGGLNVKYDQRYISVPSPSIPGGSPKTIMFSSGPAEVAYDINSYITMEYVHGYGFFRIRYFNESGYVGSTFVLSKSLMVERGAYRQSFVCITHNGSTDGSSMRAYQDGLSLSISASESTAGTWYMHYGDHNVGRHFTSVIGSYQIWNRELSNTEATLVTLYPYGTPSNPRLLFPSGRRYFFLAGAGGNVFEELISLGASLSLSESASLNFQSSASLASEASQSEAALAQMFSSLTLASSAVVTEAAGMTYLASLALESQVDTTQDNAASKEASVSLGAQVGFSPSVVASLLSSLQLSGNAGLSPAGNLVLAVSNLLAAQAAIDAEGYIGLHVYDESLALAVESALENVASYNAGPSLALGINADIDALSTLAAQALLTMGVDAAHVPSVTASFAASLAMGIEAVLTAAGTTGAIPKMIRASFSMKKPSASFSMKKPSSTFELQ